jgi:hypothetical protein
VSLTQPANVSCVFESSQIIRSGVLPRLRLRVVAIFKG